MLVLFSYQKAKRTSKIAAKERVSKFGIRHLVGVRHLQIQNLVASEIYTIFLPPEIIVYSSNNVSHFSVKYWRKCFSFSGLKS